MFRPMTAVAIAAALPFASCASQAPAQAGAKSFSFATAADSAAYSPERGYGFEGSQGLTVTKSAQSAKAFFFSTDVPAEGNYRVTVVLGGPAASKTTVKAELRRLMLESVTVPAGGSVTKSFIVNVRTPALPGGGAVQLKAPRESVQEAVAWDKRITLEFNGDNPAVRSVTVTPVTVPTIYVLGDSTSTDQSAEPYASWGQMLTAFFKPTVAVANHGESGESVGAANSRGRFEKIMSLIKPGDVFMTQFGHNDMKEMSANPAAPAKYRDDLIVWAKAVQAKGATAVIITPMNRHRFEGGKVQNSLAPYPQMAREAALASGATLIDLNEISKTLYEAVGEKESLAMFKHNADGTGRDATHHSPWGAYELAKLIVQGLRDAKLPIAREVRADLPRFDPAKPLPLAQFSVPPSPTYTDQRPLGD